MSLSAELKKWDGKSVEVLGAIYNRHSSQKMFTSDLIFYTNDIALQTGATWLLKKHFETGNTIDAVNVGNLFKTLEGLQYWESKLHVLQCLPYLEISNSDREKVENFLRKCLTEENKFVRAWAYNGFYVLSKAFPQYKEETKQFFEMAMRDEAPSVQSRIRNILKEGF